MKSTHILMMGTFAHHVRVWAIIRNGDKYAREVFAHHAGHLMSPQELQALPNLQHDYRISYGADENQFGDLRVPLTRTTPSGNPDPRWLLEG